MISLFKAIELVKQNTKQGLVQALPIQDCYARVLARDIVSNIDLPSFNKSAMDGFAIHYKENLKHYTIVDTTIAGDLKQLEIKQGQAIRIMTGAMVPKGANQVVLIENTKVYENQMTILSPSRKQNICYQGEDIKIGDVVLNAPKRLEPQDIGVVSNLGYKELDVFEKPKVGVLTTGDEVKDPGEIIKKGQIYNANGYLLTSAIQKSGGEAIYYGIATDKKEIIEEKINQALEQVDILLITGGISVGDYDFVHDVLDNLKVEGVFDKVAIKPGKPAYLGKHPECLVFGLPGNPVAAFIVFRVLVQAAIVASLGLPFELQIKKGVLMDKYKQKKGDGRLAILPVKTENQADGTLGIRLIPFHGPAHLAALSCANAYLLAYDELKHANRGDLVDFIDLF
jgi:molybdopterin molybdotransferase